VAKYPELANTTVPHSDMLSERKIVEMMVLEPELSPLSQARHKSLFETAHKTASAALTKAADQEKAMDAELPVTHDDIPPH